ncbi:MAG: hypothetical protein HYT79_00830 [Elusimicrobia bacterium]|nr:hypothetical protein [Elusimicrobiota bacterium]
MMPIWVFVFCAIVVTAAVVAGVVYLIRTLRQVERSARAMEQILLHADETVIRVNDSSRTFADWVHQLDSGLGKAVPFIAGLAWAFKKFSKEGNGTEERETKAKSGKGD